VDALKIAKSAAFEAGRILKESWNHVQTEHVKSKRRFDYVTHVDIESEKKIIEIINTAFPDHTIQAEESGIMQKEQQYRWIIDPLDGTTNYIHGLTMSTISIALQKGQNIVLGVIYDPFHNEMFSAEKGKGAFLNEQNISVTKEDDLANCLLATGFPFKNKELLEPYLQTFSMIFEEVSGVRRTGSAALDLAYVACGRYDGFWELKLSAWDIAAGVIIVSEAGGKVTDFTGNSDFLTTGNIIATNQRIHQPILNIIKQVFN